MRDGFGGILNIDFIVIFLLIVEGVLGLVVNYTKAFKMKNNVISMIEQYEAAGCFENSGNSACVKRIIDKAKEIGYSPTSLNCPSGYDSVNDLFCYRGEIVKNTDNYTSSKPTVYKVVTQVDLNLPLISNILGFSIFQVSGDTEVVES